MPRSFEVSQRNLAKWATIRQAVNSLWQNQARAADELKSGKANFDQVVAQAY